MHIALYIIIYAAVEFFLFQMGYIVYDFGWSFYFSVAWNLVMFPIIAIHYKKPLIAYGLCVVLIFAMNWMFPFKMT